MDTPIKRHVHNETQKYVGALAAKLTDKSLVAWIESYKNGKAIGYHTVKEEFGATEGHVYLGAINRVDDSEDRDVDTLTAYERAMMVMVLIDLVATNLDYIVGFQVGTVDRERLVY